MNHPIEYHTAPTARDLDTPAVRRAQFLCERDFIGAALPRPIERVLPPAAPAPADGPLDFSDALGTPWPATLPSLLAGTHALEGGALRELGADCGARILLVVEGGGELRCGGDIAALAAGDILAVPGGQPCTLSAGTDGLRIFYVDDSPMARYFGWSVQPDARSALTHWPAELLARRLEETAADGITASGVFLSHDGLPKERLATPNLFAHLNRLAPGATNTVHAHAAAAITYVIQSNPQSYSVLGEQVEGSEIVDGQRVDWHDGQVSITPPNLWHSHHNDGDSTILSLVVQLSGVYYNDRTMNFVFAEPPGP